MEWVDVKLKSELADDARKLAAARNITVSQLLRDLVTREIALSRPCASPALRDDILIERLKSRLVSDFLAAQTWSDLTARLKSKGYCLVAAGGGLALHNRATGRRVCKASELGFSYTKLMRKIGAPFPGHPNARIAKKILPEASPGFSDRVQVRAPEPEPADDFDVIEPF